MAPTVRIDTDHDGRVYMCRHLRFLELAARNAALSNCPFKHGALVVRGGSILSSAPNKHRNPPTIDYLGSSVHAEVAALRGTHAAGATLYVVRLAPSGLALSRPCPRCWTAIERSGVKAVVYSTGSGYAVERVTPGGAMSLVETPAGPGLPWAAERPSEAVQWPSGGGY
jgi:pyrimidine deaminase RibD-like protein